VEIVAVDPENPGSSASASNPPEIDSAPQSGAETEIAIEQIPLDPQTLVDQVVAAGEWPEPALLEKLIAAGEPAVAPLIAFLRTYPRGLPAEYSLDHAMRVLTALRSPDAIPELIEIIRRYDEDLGEVAARYLGSFGPIAFEPAMEVCRDSEVTGDSNANARAAAIRAAGKDPTLRARIADLMRPMLVGAMEKLRQPRQAPAKTEAHEPDLYGELLFLVNDLSALADPQARDLIRTAFSEDLVDTFFLDEAVVERRYKQGGDPLPESPNWLDDYRKRYEEAHTERPAQSPSPMVPGRSERDFHEPSVRPLETAILPPPQPSNTTIRKTGVALGRNEPCWCGSGKKYKKCHLPKDAKT
jgi:SEC-C motif